MVGQLSGISLKGFLIRLISICLLPPVLLAAYFAWPPTSSATSTLHWSRS